MPRKFKYYTPDEVEKMSCEQLANDEIWQDVLKSSQRWGIRRVLHIPRCERRRRFKMLSRVVRLNFKDREC